MNRDKYDEIKELVRASESVFELILLALLYYTVWRNLYPSELFPAYFGKGKYVLSLVYVLVTFLLFSLNGSFYYGHLKLSHISISQSIAIIITDIITYFQLSLIANKMISVYPILILILIDVITCFILCYLYTALYHKMHVPTNMLMVYDKEEPVNLKFKVDSRPDKYHVTKTMSVGEGLDQILPAILEHDAVILDDISAEARNDILKYCYENRVRIYIVPNIPDIIIRGAEDITLFDTPLLYDRGTGPTMIQNTVKRFMDILLCVIALIPAAPIMLITAVAIKLEDHGPVFYKQERVTKDMKKFAILKFRSMIVDAEKDGISVPATENDPRITKVGKVIRRFRIDELPQLINIIKGDMSIVGPRPERTEHVEKYMKEIPEFVYRYKVKGGLTGYAQIYGKYNTTAHDKLRFDLMYIENYSILMDIKLIIETIRVLFTKESTEGFKNKESTGEK